MKRIFSWPLAVALMLAPALVQQGAYGSQAFGFQAPLIAAGQQPSIRTDPVDRKIVDHLSARNLKLPASEQGEAFSFKRLEGTRWQLQQLAEDDTIPAGVVVTAEFEAARIAGSSGCNRYFAGFTAKNPDAISFSRVGVTQMACPGPQMEVEQRYIGLLSKVKQIGFDLDGLVLTYDDEGNSGKMLFSRLMEDPI